MAPPQPNPLTPVQIDIGGPEYQRLLLWPFAPVPFYEAQVTRVLDNDVRSAVMYQACRVWLYYDAGQNAVGFGTLDMCKEYARFTNGAYHAYIPLLAVNPGFQRRGHGQSIVQHLIEEAARTVRCRREGDEQVSDWLFLDVYTANQPAISLYSKCGFAILNESEPISDPEENNEPYVVMATRLLLS